jgi:predicted patatin/cPLA2 family phospholipase
VRKGDLVRIDGKVSLFEDTSADNFRFDHRTIRCDSGDTVLILTDKDEYRSSRFGPSREARDQEDDQLRPDRLRGGDQ